MHILLALVMALMTIGPLGTAVPPPCHPEGIPVTINVTWEMSARADLPYVVQIDDNVRGVVQTFEGTATPEGTITIAPDLVCGATAYFWVKGPKYLGATGTFVVDCTANVVDVTLRGGDATNDNLVNDLDFNVLRAYFGEDCNTPGYDPASDLTNDCVTTIQDFDLLKVNYGTQGDPPLL